MAGRTTHKTEKYKYISIQTAAERLSLQKTKESDYTLESKNNSGISQKVAGTPQKKADHTFAMKMKNLWKDDRTYKKRLLLALIVIFSACFTFLFFGPMEITAYAQASLVFSMKMALPVMAIVAVIICAAAALVIALLHGKVFDYLLTAVFSALICGYLQGNFFNGKLAALTGDSVKWELQKFGMVGNFFLWLLIFLIPFVVLYVSRKVWKNVLIYVSAALVVMQAVAFVTIFTNGTADTASNKDNYLTTSEMGDYSTKHNTLVFLLDRMDYEHVEEIQKQDPTFFNKLDGFTTYNNAISEHARTMPAINYLFTNDNRLWNVPAEKYFETSWSQGGKNLLKDIKNQNYKIDFYTEIGLIFGNGSTVKNEISNMSCSVNQVSYNNLIRSLSKLSAYRYAPLSMKPFFWCDTDDINHSIYSHSAMYQIDETLYDRVGDFHLTDKTNYFKYYHFMGSHTPYTVNAEGVRTGKTDVVSQTKGNFNILFRAFDKMKELGIYKDSTILILADHGEPVSDYCPLKKANRIGFFYKPAGSAGTPLKTSHAPVSFLNVPASMAKSAGIKDYHKYGKPIEEVGENDKVTRYFYKSIVEGGKEKTVYKYQIDGDAANFKNWKIISVQPAKYSFW